MLVPNMNPLEIYTEILNDGVQVMKMITTKVHLQGMIMKRTRQFKWVETLHITSARNNKWSVYINIGNGAIQTNMYVKTEDKTGITAYNFIIIEGFPCLIKYNAHFFKRYRERMALDEIKPDQIMKRFFRNNIQITPAFSEKDENGIMMASIALPEGLGLGRFSEESPITEMKTFIARSLLNKGQRELVQMLNEDEHYQQGISFVGK